MKEEDQKQNKPITDLELQMNQTKLDKGCPKCTNLENGSIVVLDKEDRCVECGRLVGHLLNIVTGDKQVERGEKKLETLLVPTVTVTLEVMINADKVDTISNKMKDFAYNLEADYGLIKANLKRTKIEFLNDIHA